MLPERLLSCLMGSSLIAGPCCLQAHGNTLHALLWCSALGTIAIHNSSHLLQSRSQISAQLALSCVLHSMMMHSCFPVLLCSCFHCHSQQPSPENTQPKFQLDCGTTSPTLQGLQAQTQIYHFRMHTFWWQVKFDTA